MLGAGQLGRMLAQEAVGWNLQLSFLDKSQDYPAPKIHPGFIKGDFTDYNDVLQFGMDKDIITIEIENVNTEALKALEKSKVKVYPQSRVIETIKDKGLQKEFYNREEIPTAPFFLVKDKAEIIRKINTNELNFPFIQKARTAGYDGKGVALIKSVFDIDKLLELSLIHI